MQTLCVREQEKCHFDSKKKNCRSFCERQLFFSFHLVNFDSGFWW